MDQPIMFTGREFLEGVLGVCAGIITIAGALTIIVKAIKAWKAPDKKQDERIAALEKENEERRREIASILERLALGNKRFEADAEKMEEVKNSMRGYMTVIIGTLQALTTHAIEGNNIAELKEARKQLTDYLVRGEDHETEKNRNSHLRYVHTE